MPVAFGMPAPELLEAEERGEVVIGGCMPSPAGDVLACTACRARGVRRRGRFIPMEDADRIAWLDPDAPDRIRNRSALLAANDAPSLAWLADRCVDACLDNDLLLAPISAPFAPGVYLEYAAGWDNPYLYTHEIYYPFTNDHFWSVVEDIGDLCRFDNERFGLQEAIRAVEGFPVQVEGLDIDTPSSRRLTIGGYIHELPDYPYVRAMPDRCTVAEWRAKRFLPNYPGLTADVVGEPGFGAAPLDDDATLRTARPQRRVAQD